MATCSICGPDAARTMRRSGRGAGRVPARGCRARDRPARARRADVPGPWLRVRSADRTLRAPCGARAAAQGVSPHEDVELATGRLERGELTCRGHGYVFDLRTGRCAHDASLELRR